MKIVYVLFAWLLLLCYGCGFNQTNTGNATTSKDTMPGRVEIYDPAALVAVDSNATIEVIASGFTWSEGPVWIADKQMLLFSDVPENKIYQWKEGDSATLYLMPSGYTGTVKRIGGEDGSNGLASDNEGRLLLCQSGNRQVVRMNAPLDSPKPDFLVLTGKYNGQRFNSPNDLVMDSKQNIYFTDPIYGLPQRENDSTREMRIEGVYRINAKGETTLLIDSIRRPNGIALSADEKTLYIGSSDDTHPRWYVYELDVNRGIKSGGILLDATSLKERASVKQGCDGFKIDKHGNLFASGPDGINIISPKGKLLALIKIDARPTSNCAFNETKNLLYITADDMVLRVRLHH